MSPFCFHGTKTVTVKRLSDVVVFGGRTTTSFCELQPSILSQDKNVWNVLFKVARMDEPEEHITESVL